MDLAQQIQRWADFFAETPLQATGDKEKEEKKEKKESEFKKEILLYLQNLHSLLVSAPLTTQYLATRSSLPQRALALYYLHETLTDAELAEHLKLNKKRAADIRKKPSIADLVEAKTQDKPAHYGLTAPAKVQEEEALREWLRSLLDAEERDERLQQEREASLLEQGEGLPFIVGSLRPEIADQLRRGDCAVPVDFGELARFDPDLADFLLDHPADCLKAARLAFKSFDAPQSENIRFLVEGLPDSSQLSLREVRTRHVGQLVEAVTEPESISEVRPRCVLARFECPSCGNVLPVVQEDEKFKEPTSCACGRRGKFRVVERLLTDSAVVGLTQPLGEVLSGQGRRAQMRLLVDGVLASPERMKQITPGLPLRVVAYPVDLPVLLRTGGQSVRRDLALQAVSFAPVKDYSFSLQFTDEEIAEFRTAAQMEDFLTAFAETCFFRHHSDQHIKQAVALQLVRGRFETRKDEEGLNILLSGDPGTGKTRNFLRRAAELAPIARFVQATNSTQAGLLGSGSMKEQDSGRFVYEPGALPRAHRGLLVIDEIAALQPEETKALNEALEEGSITIDKATLHLTVPADVACLAAGNPKGGRFDLYNGVTAEALGIEPSTLDRFDLVYVLADVPDQERDRRVVDRMIAGPEAPRRWTDNWLRRFVLYARYAFRPVLRPEEAEELKRFYVGMRQSSTAGTLAISARQFRSLRALTLLSAKLHLRSETRPDDVRVATKLLEPMLRAFGFDLSNLQRWNG